jgi:hypothetical protein
MLSKHSDVACHVDPIIRRESFLQSEPFPRSRVERDQLEGVAFAQLAADFFLRTTKTTSRDGVLSTDELVARATLALERASLTCEPPTYVYSPAHMYAEEEEDLTSPSTSFSDSSTSTPSPTSPSSSFYRPSAAAMMLRRAPPSHPIFNRPARKPLARSFSSDSIFTPARGGFFISPVDEFEAALTPLLDALPLAESYVGTTKRRLGFRA